MITDHNYPKNYFDPHGDDQRAQCKICARWFDPGDIDNVVEVPCMIYGTIYQGICHGCADDRCADDN